MRHSSLLLEDFSIKTIRMCTHGENGAADECERVAMDCPLDGNEGGRRGEGVITK